MTISPMFKKLCFTGVCLPDLHLMSGQSSPGPGWRDILQLAFSLIANLVLQQHPGQARPQTQPFDLLRLPAGVPRALLHVPLRADAYANLELGAWSFEVASTLSIFPGIPDVRGTDGTCKPPLQLSVWVSACPGLGVRWAWTAQACRIRLHNQSVAAVPDRLCHRCCSSSPAFVLEPCPQQ